MIVNGPSFIFTDRVFSAKSEYTKSDNPISPVFTSETHLPQINVFIRYTGLPNH